MAGPAYNAALSILHQAMQSELGLVVKVIGAPRASGLTRLTATRQANKPLFASLQIRMSPFDEQDLWIVRRPDGDESNRQGDGEGA